MNHRRVGLGILAVVVIVLLAFVVAVLRMLTTYAAPPVDPAWAVEGARSVPEGAVSVRFTGTSTLLLSDGETAWIVDGWFSRFGPLAMLGGEVAPDLEAIERGLARNEVDRLAAVIPVHSHYDHAMDAPEVARRTGALLIGSESTANIGRGWGLPEEQIRVVRGGERLRLGDFEVTLVATKHFQFADPELRERALGSPRIETPLEPPVGIFEYRVGQPFALHVVHPRGRFLVQGSAGYEVGGLEGLEADVVFLGIGGLGTQTEAYRERYWRETVGRSGARRVVAIHWDSLMGPIEGPFTGELRAASILAGGTEETRAFLESRLAAESDLRIETLPRYAPVVVF